MVSAGRPVSASTVLHAGARTLSAQQQLLATEHGAAAVRSMSALQLLHALALQLLYASQGLWDLIQGWQLRDRPTPMEQQQLP